MSEAKNLMFVPKRKLLSQKQSSKRIQAAAAANPSRFASFSDMPACFMHHPSCIIRPLKKTPTQYAYTYTYIYICIHI